MQSLSDRAVTPSLIRVAIGSPFWLDRRSLGAFRIALGIVLLALALLVNVAFHWTTKRGPGPFSWWAR